MPCRGDVAIQLVSPAATLRHNTVWGEGRCLLGMSGAGTATARNNVFVGALSVVTGTQTCFDRLESGATLDHDYGVIWQAIGTVCPRGANDLCVDPLLTDVAPETFDAHLRVGSPARDSGLAGGNEPDREGVARPVGGGLDRGAYEQ
jgi:hypothetical protein